MNNLEENKKKLIDKTEYMIKQYPKTIASALIITTIVAAIAIQKLSIAPSPKLLKSFCPPPQDDCQKANEYTNALGDCVKCPRH